MTTTADTTPHQLLIGERLPANAGLSYVSENPYCGQGWATVPNGGAGDVDGTMTAARAAPNGPWGAMMGFQRAALMRRLASLIARDACELAAMETRDDGKLLRETLGALECLPAWLDYYARVANKLQGEVISDRSNFLGLRTGCRCLDVQPMPRPWRRAPAAGRHGLGQLLPRRRLQRSFWWSRLQRVGREPGPECQQASTETKAIWIELERLTRDPFRTG